MRTRQFTQELRLLGSVGTTADWTVGAFYYNAHGFSSGRINLPGGFALGGGGLNPGPRLIGQDEPHRFAAFRQRFE